MFLTRIILFFALISLSFAGIGFGALGPKPDKFKDMEGCYISEFDTVIPYDSALRPNTSCIEYTCYHDKIRTYTCSPTGILRIPPGCSIVDNTGKPFPVCCNHLSCPDNE